MTHKTLEGMARASVDADGCDGDYDKNPHEIREALATDMKRGLEWLSSNVTDDMVHSLIGEFFLAREPGFKFEYGAEHTRKAISAALRAAAGSALEAKPCGAAKEG